MKRALTWPIRLSKISKIELSFLLNKTGSHRVRSGYRLLGRRFTSILVKVNTGVWLSHSRIESKVTLVLDKDISTDNYYIICRSRFFLAIQQFINISVVNCSANTQLYSHSDVSLLLKENILFPGRIFLFIIKGTYTYNITIHRKHRDRYYHFPYHNARVQRQRQLC